MGKLGYCSALSFGCWTTMSPNLSAAEQGLTSLQEGLKAIEIEQFTNELEVKLAELAEWIKYGAV
jgi:hypothetical protein